MHGIVNVFKPQDFTSHDCVAILRGVTGIKKIGHTGTLDPMATGVLPCCIGKATRIIEYLDNDVKEYECTMKLGYVSDTMDIWGDVSKSANCEIPDPETIVQALRSFEGDIEQIPPKYSAIKVNGRKLYEYARAGQQVEIKSRKVSIYSIDVLDIKGDTVSFSMKCGKGTYVRSVCHDTGTMLGCGAVMTDLKRTSNGIFTADQAVDIRTIKSSDLNYVKSIIRPIDEPLSFRKTDIGEKEAKDLSDGKIIKISGTYDENERLKVYCNSKFVGVGIYNEKVLKADKIFNTEIR